MRQHAKAEELGSWESRISDQLAATASNTALTAHRELVQNRWKLTRSFGLPDASPSKLSPQSKKMKMDVFGDDPATLSTALLKSYKKKFQGYVQCLSNASDRLNEVHREDIGMGSRL